VPQNLQRFLSLPPALPAALLVAAALALQGCGTPPSGRSGPATPAEVAVQRVTGLANERQWLQSWFMGTPVAIAQPDDATVTVDVPLAYSFDKGRSSVKPALGAVLDKVAESLRRMPSVQARLVAAPGDGTGSALALRRAAAVRKHLLGRGVPSEQLGPASAADAAAVQLRLALAPA
jgi:outer membrane protein OmpA-like peptidoglycan-associated protein